VDAGVVRAWQANSAHRKGWPLKRLQRDLFAGRDDPLVAIWGLTYKPDTHSTKNSPALELLDGLRGRRVRAHDPVAVLDASEYGWVTRCAAPLDAADGADALVVMSPWKVYGAVAAADIARRLRGKLVLDPYGALDAPAFRAAGLEYHRLGC
jgi:UDPglucose 6-dehydrogenase